MSKSKKIDVAGSPSKRKDFVGNEDILMPSLVSSSDLKFIRKAYDIPKEVHLVLPPPGATANSIIGWYYCMYKIWLEVSDDEVSVRVTKCYTSIKEQCLS